jgi:pyridoxine 4-dehydrogenase
MSLRRLAVECIDLYYLHRIDPAVPLTDQLGALADLQRAGKIRHIGLSKVTVDQIRQATDIVTVAAVQNRFHLVAADDPALAFCENAGIAYVPYAPLAAGGLLWARGSLDYFARAHGTTPAQLALGWLLTASAVTLPIPGTSSISHLNDNVATDVDNVPSAALAAAVRAFRPSPRAASTVTGRP